tara:strand:+ start:2296 stop:3546 length:1251 start_codon:yes stop_codon:yes gene_type:complete
MINFIKKSKTSFFDNSFYLYLSHFGDYILTLFLLPFISRKIGATEFGIIGLTQSFGLLIVLFIEFGSSLMATREVARIKNDHFVLKKFVEELTLSKIYLTPIAFVAFLLSIIYVPIFIENPYKVVIIFLGAIFQGISPVWYFQGTEKMKIIAFSKLVFRLFGFILIIFFVKSPSDSWVVLASFSLGSALICLYLFREIIKKHGQLSLYRKNQSKLIFSKSIPSFLVTIIPMIYQNISVLLLSLFVNPIQLGLFYGASRIYRAFNTLYSPVSQAFFPIIASAQNNDKTESRLLLRNYLLTISIIGLLFFITNYFFAEKIILIVLGNEFSGSKNLLKIFSVVLPLTAISNALGRQWLMVINKDSFYSFVQMFSSLIALMGFLFLVNAYGIKAYPLSLIVYEISSIFIILIFLVSNESS